jgi:hypothetical protein
MLYGNSPGLTDCDRRFAVPPGFMNAQAHYIDVGVVHISVANLTVIVLMIVVFVLAVLLPFPGGSGDEQ